MKMESEGLRVVRHIARFKSYIVDLDKNGEGLKGFRRFRSLEKASLYARAYNGKLFRESQDGELKEIRVIKDLYRDSVDLQPYTIKGEVKSWKIKLFRGNCIHQPIC